MPASSIIIKRIKGRDRLWAFVNKLDNLPQSYYHIEEIQVVDLEIDDEDVLDWFLRHALPNPQLPNLKRAILYMDGLEVSLLSHLLLRSTTYVNALAETVCSTHAGHLTQPSIRLFYI